MKSEDEFNKAQQIKVQLLQKLIEEVNSLPDLCKAVYLKVFLLNQDAIQISRDLNLTADTVRLQFQKALRLLKSKILKDSLMLRICDHKCKIGDNDGISCSDCGEILEGFGYRAVAMTQSPPGQPAVCKHAWYAEDNMLLAVCTWCEATTPNPNYLTIEDAEAAAGGAFAD